MAASAIIDPTKPGQYPVVLSDSLLGKPSKETYTGVNCMQPTSRPLTPGVAVLDYDQQLTFDASQTTTDLHSRLITPRLRHG